MRTWRKVGCCLVAAVAAVTALSESGLALDLPAGEVWDRIALGRTPRAFEVELPCSNDCGS